MTETPDAAKTPDSPMRSALFCCGAPIAFAALFGVLVGGCAYFSNDDSHSTGPSDILAEYACRDHVKDGLKNPKSAEFSNETTTGGPVEYTVTGTVRGENSFGGTAVHQYTCDATWQGDEEAFYTTYKITS